MSNYVRLLITESDEIVDLTGGDRIALTEGNTAGS